MILVVGLVRPALEARREVGRGVGGLIGAEEIERLMTRPTPVSPTNMWCASSVSMKWQVRDSGSKALSASDFSWNLPSRSVK